MLAPVDAGGGCCPKLNGDADGAAADAAAEKLNALAGAAGAAAGAATALAPKLNRPPEGPGTTVEAAGGGLAGAVD